MKRHSLFKVMGIMLLLLVVLSYIIPGRTGEVTYLPFGDIVTYYIQTYYYFFDTLVFILVVGAFYGVLNKTDAYKKLLDKITKKVKSLGDKFIYIVIILFALITSLTGMTSPLLVFVPLVISIILLLGYDKLVALSSTIVAMLVGFIGGIFVTLRDPGNYYSYSATTMEKLVGAEKFANIIPKAILLVLGTALLILFVRTYLKEQKSKKVKSELTNTDLLRSEEKITNKDAKVWPLVTILSVTLVLLILGLLPWTDLFGVKVFSNFHTWLTTKLVIKDFNVFTNIISTVFAQSTFTGLGNWASLGNYLVEIVLILIVTLVVKLTCKVKFDDAFDGFVEGTKKLLPTAMLIMIAYCILICSYNNGFIETIITKASSNGDINFVVSSLITLLGSLFNADIYYAAAGVFTPIYNVVADESMLNVFAMSFQSLYGLISIIGPTSIVLIFGLTYLDVPYTTWIKYIWRFILSLFIIIFAVLLILALI